MNDTGIREIPLSYGQRALWFVQRLAPSATAYNVSLPARAGELDTAAFVAAWQMLADRHPVLRTTYPAPGGSPIGRLHARFPVDAAEVDAEGWSAEELAQRVGEEANRPFALERGPVMRLRLFRQTGEVVTLLGLHHISIDFSSLAILLEELGTAYAAARQARAIGTGELPPLTATYEEFALWQAEMLAGPRGESLWSFWRSRLAGAPPSLHLPVDRPRPRVPSFRGVTLDLVLGPETTRGLKALAADAGVGLDTLALTAFQALLHRYSGQQDVLVGSPVPGRGLPDFAEVVGYFVNTVVLRGDFAGAPSFRTALARMQARVDEARAHEDFPFPLLVERLQPQREAGQVNLIQVFFVLYQGQEERAMRLLTGQGGTALELGGLRLEPWPIAGRAAMFDLSLLMGDAGDRITASFQYNSDLFEAATVARLTDDFAALLEAVLADPDRSVASLPASLGEARRSVPTAPTVTAASPLPQATPEAVLELDRPGLDDRADRRRALLERQKNLRSNTHRNRT
jgi:Condensation domain